MDPSLDRYSRQVRFYGVGQEGQRRLLASHVTLCGCGALGTVLANALVRAGVRQFHVGRSVRPGGSWKAYVDARHVRSWRLLLDDAVAAA